MIRMLDHAADVGFEVVEAPTLERLFDEAHRALLMTMFEWPPEKGEEERLVRLSAPDLERFMEAATRYGVDRNVDATAALRSSRFRPRCAGYTRASG